jgi:hypothetical protein
MCRHTSRQNPVLGLKPMVHIVTTKRERAEGLSYLGRHNEA